MEEMKKRPREEEDHLDEDIVAWLTLDEDTVSELMKCLEETGACGRDPTRVRFTENPYTTPLIFQSSSSYVTINGNEESCGSSFSDSESSMMASVDVSGIVNVSGGAWGTSEEEARGVEECLPRFPGEEEERVTQTLTVFDQEREGT